MLKSVNSRWSWTGLKKNLRASHEEKRGLIDWNHDKISVASQCELLGISRSSLYYRGKENLSEDFGMMNMIDAIYTKWPFYGSRKIAAVLSKELSIAINRKRIQRLMRLMGIEAIYPKPSLSKANKSHKIYPYLLSGYNITAPNQVWSTDITYVRLSGGFAYLVAIIDWFSRYVLSWRLSNTMDVQFCLDALQSALGKGKPMILNSDQGSQFTSVEFTGAVLAAGISISMDGKGRALDNVFVERLWRSVKYEDIYIKGYTSISSAHVGLDGYFDFYNCERPHQSLDYATPKEVHFAH